MDIVSIKERLAGAHLNILTLLLDLGKARVKANGKDEDKRAGKKESDEGLRASVKKHLSAVFYGKKPHLGRCTAVLR